MQGFWDGLVLTPRKSSRRKAGGKLARALLGHGMGSQSYGNTDAGKKAHHGALVPSATA